MLLMFSRVTIVKSRKEQAASYLLFHPDLSLSILSGRLYARNTDLNNKYKKH